MTKFLNMHVVKLDSDELLQAIRSSAVKSAINLVATTAIRRALGPVALFEVFGKIQRFNESKLIERAIIGIAQEHSRDLEGGAGVLIQADESGSLLVGWRVIATGSDPADAFVRDREPDRLSDTHSYYWVTMTID